MWTEEKIIKFIYEDKWMMEVLKAAKSLHLPDWWICAGFVRSKIWDTLHCYNERTLFSDIDVIYFDPTNTEVLEEKKLEEKLHSIIPDLPWSVKNQARMHLKNNTSPYSSSIDAISKFPETATALGLTLNHQDKVILTAPCGIDDVLHLEVKPTPFFKGSTERMDAYRERIFNKKWDETWNQLNIFCTD
ncbi:nucleotidyltransferase family protein [Gracilibacillus caseinilyticus]|uniref:Nucleotidyltransferase family protein n=1 Tax=Gracilibacillus caseinilyticus TaxID=2932256 RepID=A0ABY4EYK9_9BACI|nr:nucleotidyltransferase family protein [Gracilibacillus caseinilyticus]UOQ48987.1 nucleotidyltransferase family protein [Gracilibacillus caseinilyticus]